jgi:tetratricopeptide (TPR) repeat protein
MAGDRPSNSCAQICARIRYRTHVDPRCCRSAVWVVLVGLAVMLASPPLQAAGEDAAAEATVQDVLSNDYANAKYDVAQKKLEAALAKCKGVCSGTARAQIHVVLGMIASQLGKKAEAKTEFADALAADPTATLPSGKATADMNAAFDEAKKAAVAAAAPASTASGTPAIPGWTNIDAFQEASAARAAEQVGRYEQCVEHDMNSIKLEPHPRVQLHLAACEMRTGKLLDALKNSNEALKKGLQENDAELLRIGKLFVGRILELLPHVKFQIPSDVTDVNLKVDGNDIDPTKCPDRGCAFDPGDHTVEGEAIKDGVSVQDQTEFTTKNGETATVPLRFTLDLKGIREYIQCLKDAKTEDDKVRCIRGSQRSALVIKAGTGLAAYSDTNHVDVISPDVNASIVSPTGGWNVAGSFLVDVVSAASPDIVSEASPPYHEKRYAGTLSGGYKPGALGINAHGQFSREPDYQSIGGGADFTYDLKNKLITPEVGAGYRHDLIGRTDTVLTYNHPFDVYNFDGSVTIIMSPTTILVTGASLEVEHGDQSKPYRYIPMFDATDAGNVPAGFAVGDINSGVNGFRLPIKPLEQLPTSRDRYAIAARIAHRFSTSTIRLEERIYYDTWGIKASTTDGRYLMDIGQHLRVWPHLRLNAQSGADFYQLAYTAALGPNVNSGGNYQIVLPLYRTDSRDLSPLLTTTIGGGSRIDLSPTDAKTQYGFTFQTDLMYTKFFNSLYITSVTGIYGSLDFDVEFE